jgi:hypothetical protein
VDALSLVAANDDVSADDPTSRVGPFAVTAGATYRIVVDGFNPGATPAEAKDGTISLQWSFTPANDTFAAAQMFAGPTGSVAGTNVGATKEAGEPGHPDDEGGKSVWYGWTAPASGLLTVATAGSVDTPGLALDTLLAVYTGSGLDALWMAAWNDDVSGVDPTSRVGPFAVTAGTTYWIAVDGFNPGATPADAKDGTISLQWTLADVPSAPEAVTALAGDSSAEVSWSAPGSDGGSAITNYVVTPYVGAEAQPATEVEDDLSATITGLTNGTAYTFKWRRRTLLGRGRSRLRRTR